MAPPLVNNQSIDRFFVMMFTLHGLAIRPEITHTWGMTSLSFAEATREFDVLVRKAARDGFLDLQSLQSAYRELRPIFHPEIDNDRRVDLEALTYILRQLPLAFVTTHRMMLVPDLTAFHHTPAISQGLAGGLLHDGTLLLEAPYGLRSVMSVATLLAGLALEVRKALDLLFAAAQNRRNAQMEWEEPEGGVEESGATTALEADAALGATDLSPEEDDANRWAHIALDLGVDQHALLHANAETDGALCALLFDREHALPDIDIHAELQPAWINKRRRATADKVIQAFAERGFLQRPVVVWISPVPVRDCFSPFVRDLREPLWAWAQSGAEGLGSDLYPLPEQPNEDLMYCIAHDFIATDQALAAERASVDRSVGIVTLDMDGIAIDVIDTGRLDSNACDVRLQPWEAAVPAPVIVGLPWHAVAGDGAILEGLLQTLGAAIQGVTVLLPGTSLNGMEGRIFAPTLTIDWAGEDVLATPVLAPLGMDAFGVSAQAPMHAAVLSAPCIEAMDHRHLEQLGRQWGVQALVLESTSVLKHLRNAMWRGSLPNLNFSHSYVIATQPTAGGRMSWTGTAAFNAVSIATVRQLATASQATPEPPRTSRNDPTQPAKKAARPAEAKGKATPSRTDTGFRKPYLAPGVRIKG